MKGRDNKRKVCKCIIRGVVWLGVRKKIPDRNGTLILVHPIEHIKFLRKFKYCPICGKKIEEL